MSTAENNLGCLVAVPYISSHGSDGSVSTGELCPEKDASGLLYGGELDSVTGDVEVIDVAL